MQIKRSCLTFSGPACSSTANRRRGGGWRPFWAGGHTISSPEGGNCALYALPGLGKRSCPSRPGTQGLRGSRAGRTVRGRPGPRGQRVKDGTTGPGTPECALYLGGDPSGGPVLHYQSRNADAVSRGLSQPPLPRRAECAPFRDFLS